MSRVVVVTGGFGVLGRAVAARAEAEGYSAVRVDLATPPAGVAQAHDLTGVDITDPAAAEHALRQTADRFGGVDVLINVAGGFVWRPFGTDAAETWAQMHRVNVTTTVTMTQAALPYLLQRPGARIVNIGANAASKAAAGMGPYAAAKAGVARLTESLAEELKGKDITVNAVLPSIIDTPTNHADMPDSDSSDWVKPDALADVILFLASPGARAITGALVPVTRGG